MQKCEEWKPWSFHETDMEIWVFFNRENHKDLGKILINRI